MTKTLTLTMQIRRESDHFSAKCLELDISTFGTTHEEALDMIKDAVVSFLETASPEEVQGRLTAYERRYRTTRRMVDFPWSPNSGATPNTSAARTGESPLVCA